MKRKELLLLACIMVLSMVLMGCVGGNNAEIVWDTYNGEDFVLGYPGEWSILEESQQEVFIGDADTEEDANKMISFQSLSEEYTETDWNAVKTNIEDELSGEVVETTIEGYPAYKIQTTIQEISPEDNENGTIDIAYIYKSNFIYILMYGGKDGNYSSDMSDEIFDRFEF